MQENISINKKLRSGIDLIEIKRLEKSYEKFGMRMLTRLYDESEIDIFSKMKQWLLLDGDKIIWVCGRRISDDIKVTSRTTKFAKFIIE